MLDGRGFPDECFVEGLEYSEGDGLYTKYGKCIGFRECVKRDPIAAIQCYLYSYGLAAHENFMAEEFIRKALNNELEVMYPHRLCTNVDGGCCKQYHVVTDEDVPF